jgi:hypothetical protein
MCRHGPQPTIAIFRNSVILTILEIVCLYSFVGLQYKLSKVASLPEESQPLLRTPSSSRIRCNGTVVFIKGILQASQRRTQLVSSSIMSSGGDSCFHKSSLQSCLPAEIRVSTNHPFATGLPVAAGCVATRTVFWRRTFLTILANFPTTPGGRASQPSTHVRSIGRRQLMQPV